MENRSEVGSNKIPVDMRSAGGPIKLDGDEKYENPNAVRNILVYTAH